MSRKAGASAHYDDNDYDDGYDDDDYYDDDGEYDAYDDSVTSNTAKVGAACACCVLTMHGAPSPQWTGHMQIALACS